ncbi:MAG: ABC transporter permease [Bacillus thermozeamaize]|jgi:fructooligosaccharide transport system permease protein|uniref:ABC transporter permease n=1 Tax=Bacillus thermozeamaize TaxID=230954 RepID=A0A1Y3PGQ1_9BACI|nr:MAG: ABC transporter permease [Bacillus thermozeamaize]
MTLRYICLILLAIVFLFPTVWMLAASTKSDVMIYSEIGTLESFVPNFHEPDLIFDNYIDLFVEYNVWKYMLNSLMYASVIVVGNILFNSMAGYALAKYYFPGQRLIMGIIIFLIVVPIETTVIPLYTIVHNMKLTGTVLAVLIPPMVSTFNIFLFRQYFVSVPRELEEAALIDGANKVQVYFKIIMATSKPIVATIATLTFIGAWNDYVWPIMVLPAPSGKGWPLYPIQAALNTIQNLPTITTGEVMAALTVTTIPLVIIYVFAQKYIVDGFMTAGIR